MPLSSAPALAVIAAAAMSVMPALGQSGWPQAPDLADPAASTGCTAGPSAQDLLLAYPPGTTTAISMQSAGLERVFTLHVPAGASSAFLAAPQPLVLMFHGGTGSAGGIEGSTGMSNVSDANAFYVIYPDSSDGSFNAGNGCCGSAPAVDIPFVRDILDWAQGTLCVDDRRIFSTGFSNGAIMSYGISCDEDIGNRLAAIAPVGGTPPNICPPESIPPGLALLHIHGTADANVPIGGGSGCGNGVTVFSSLSNTVSSYREAAGCQDSVSLLFAQGSGNCLIADASSTCTDSIVVCLLQGAGHSWPGGTPKLFDLPQCILQGQGFQDFDFKASENIWGFFAANPKAPPPPAPPSPPVEEECPLNGDLNLDSVKNVLDVVALLDEVVNS